MKYLYRPIFLFSLSMALALGAAPAKPQQKGPTQQQIDRGKYLVEEVAKCAECHTPRNSNHQLDPDRWLQGAITWIQPVFSTTDWAEFAPPLAGLSNYSDEQAERVLEKGERANGGGAVQQPMHVYHMDPEDAKAIIAYLRSLPTHY